MRRALLAVAILLALTSGGETQVILPEGGVTAVLPTILRSGIFTSPSVLVPPGLGGVAITIPIADLDASNPANHVEFAIEQSLDGVNWAVPGNICGGGWSGGTAPALPGLSCSSANVPGRWVRAAVTVDLPMVVGAVVVVE